LKRARSNNIDLLRGPLLRSVSRSFYLSIRLLPAQLRDPIALAYLLARATDTLADTAEASATLRDESLRNLGRAIQGQSSEDGVPSLRHSFAPRQKSAAERTLIEALPRCLEWLEHLEKNDRDDIRIVLEHINCGQLLDVRRFGDAAETHALATESELDEYTYLVAGSVGEFWTELCFRHLKDFSDQSPERMRNLGREYGKGLQLVNILRDAGSDLAHGRCYFPKDELEARGVAPNEMISRRPQVAPIIEKWRQRAERKVAAGIDYCCAIKPARVRFATALPALIGARTLALLREAGVDALKQNIKVPRHEVRAIMSSTTMSLASPRRLRKNFERLGREEM
jgi:farnesyl-diphosphate farnesyltransferase